MGISSGQPSVVPVSMIRWSSGGVRVPADAHHPVLPSAAKRQFV
jgi:hypothetical protein